MVLKSSIVVAILSIGIAYYVYEPVPPGWSQPWKTRFFLTTQRTLDYLAQFAQLIGYDYTHFTRESWVAIFPKLQTRKHLDDIVVTSDISIKGVPVRVYRLKDNPQATPPAMIYYHGGGWVIGSYKLMDVTIKRMVRDLGVTAIAPDYRLAPENPFPLPLDDCVMVTKFFLHNAEEFRIDPLRVLLSGESAGGNLAAAVAMRLAEDNFHVKPKVVALFYPVVQGLNLQTPSYQANRDGPWLTHPAMGFFFSNYVEGHMKTIDDYLENKHVPRNIQQGMAQNYMQIETLPKDDILKNYNESKLAPVEKAKNWYMIKDVMLNPYVSPLFASNEQLKGLPIIYINVCQYDVLRDEGIWFGQRLKKAGVNVKVDVLPCFHAWNLLTEDIESADKAMKTVVQFVEKHL